MRVLVTGASGFIGRTLVKHLAQSGHQTILLLEKKAIEEQFSPTDEAGSLSIDHFFHGDLRYREEITEIVRCTKPDCVVHLAAVGVTDPYLDYQSAIENNVLGTVNLLHALFTDQGEGHSCEKIIVARTPGETTNMNVYAASKAAAWAFCSLYSRTEGWPIAGAIIHQVYGSGQPAHTLVPSAIMAALRGRDFPMTSGGQIRDWIYIDDVAEGLISMIHAGLTPGTSIDLGTGTGTTVLEVVRKIYRITGQGGEPLVGALPDRPAEALHQVANAARTEELTGWRWRISIDQGLQMMISASLAD